jgi:hypothetical protein
MQDHWGHSVNREGGQVNNGWIVDPHHGWSAAQSAAKRLGVGGRFSGSRRANVARGDYGGGAMAAGGGPGRNRAPGGVTSCLVRGHQK